MQAKCEVENDPLGRKIGEYLWPEWFPKKHWEQYEIFPSVWNALFQQRPTALEGDLFKPDRITVVDAIPSNVIRWCRGWDLASTIDGDWTAGVRMGRMEDGRYIISHVARFRKTPDERDTLMLSLASQDSRETTISIPQDPGQAGKTQIAYLSRQFAGYKIESSPETGKKDTRAEPFASQVNLGNVLLLRGDWNYALIEELRNFRPDSKGQVDDQVDACSRAFSYVMQKRKTWFG